jgi:hypothetical protein
MRDELRHFALVPVFGIAGALATAVMWQVFAATWLAQVPPPYEILACVVAGLIGPPSVWALVWLATRGPKRSALRELRPPALVGLGLVLATELAFYLPLGFFAIAMHAGV